jgi:hypothetical protein
MKVVENPFKFTSFGNKKFHLLLTANKKLVEKKYNKPDFTCYLNGDEDFNELKFADSKLKQQLQNYFEIPYVAIDWDKKLLQMQDVSKQLAKFGPPELPTEKQLQTLVTLLGKKDALFTTKPSHLSLKFGKPVKKFGNLLNNIFRSQLTKKQKEICSTVPWLQHNIKLLAEDKGDEFMEKLYQKYIDFSIKIFNKFPWAVQHGDFYFSNIGFNQAQKPVVIDWENVMLAPVGLDYVSLTDGMPPLPYSQNMPIWYLQSYNQNSSEKMSAEQFKNITSELKDQHFYVAGVIDCLRFAYNDKLPAELKAKMKDKLEEWISDN